MRKGKLIDKIFGIVLACLLVGGMSCGLIDYVRSDANGDGISDTLYGIDSDNDNYPLMELFENDGTTGVSLTPALYLVYQADLSDVELGKEDEIMEGVKEVIERRIDALGYIESIVQVQKYEGEWSIVIQIPGIAGSEKVKEMVGLFTVFEFRELDEERKEWVPATGIVTVNGEEKELVLSSRYFQENTYVVVDQLGNPLLIFEWDETGAHLSKQITSRLIGKILAIYLGDKPLRGEDGNPIAPVVESVIEDKGQIQGLSLTDAQELSRLLNAGRIPVPLGRWVEEGQSKVFEPNVPLYEGQVTPMVAAGIWHTVGLKTDGTVVAVGDNWYGQCDVGGWTGITQVAAGGEHTVGLKTDGTVVAVGWN